VIPFPPPTATIAGRNFWSKGDVRRWIAAVVGKPGPDPQLDDDQLLNSVKVRSLFGDVSTMWLWRRRHPDRAANSPT
jgi:hypothetical protein